MSSNEIVTLLSSVKTQASDLIMDELKKSGVKGISPSHGFILHSLFKRDGLMMREINEKINKRKNTVTVLIEKLVSLGYIEKKSDIQDKRITRIFLTEKGRSFEKVFRDVSKTLIEKIYSGFTEGEKSKIMMLLEKIRKNLE